MAKYEKTAPHGVPRRDIRSPWRQLLSLPLPCHVHWPLSCCQSLSRPPAICGKPCFRDSPRIQRAGCHGSKGRNTIPLVRRGYAAGAWTPAWVRGGGAWRRGRAACVSRVPGCSDADACRRWLGERVGTWASWCLPAVRGRACVGAWAGGASGGSFGAFTPVAVWAIARLLRWGPVLCRKVTNGGCYQGSQEFSASAVACRPDSLADAQGPAVAFPPHTPVCAVASYLPCMSRFHSI